MQFAPADAATSMVEGPKPPSTCNQNWACHIIRNSRCYAVQVRVHNTRHRKNLVRMDVWGLVRIGSQ
jgi:hypothetical protein